MSFKEFCDLKMVRYWRQQLNDANIKNIQNESQLGGTRKAYTYGLLRFHNWLCGRRFQHTTTTHINKDMMQQCKVSVMLDGIEHLLSLYMSTDSKTDFVRLIKEYLGNIAFEKKLSLVKNSMYAIRSFFRENESEIIFYFKPRVRSAKKIPTAPLSVGILQKILTLRNIQPIEKAVFLCKFQRGLDSSTFADRFNFEVWEQLVEYFQSDRPSSWDVKNTPVPIQLRRTKTDFLHTGFLDTDAVVALIEYLHVRHATPKVGEALFVNHAKKPITVNWISRRFHKLVARTESLHGEHIMNQCTPHEMRDLLKSTLIDSGCRPDVADHVLGHSPKDSYEKQALLYPESLTHNFSKASERINILSGYHNKKRPSRSIQNLQPHQTFSELHHYIIMHEKRISQLEQSQSEDKQSSQDKRVTQDGMHEKTSLGFE